MYNGRVLVLVAVLALLVVADALAFSLHTSPSARAIRQWWARVESVAAHTEPGR